LSYQANWELVITWVNDKPVDICYSPARRSVLGKIVPEVSSTSDRGHSFSQYGPTKASE